MPERPRRRRRPALTLALGLLVLAGATEAVLRWTASRPRGTRTHTADPVLHHRLRADVRTEVRGVPFETNTQGLRDREYPPGKPAGVFRILMLGDSFTEGGGLRLEETAPKRLEALLGARGCPRPVEVVNAGVASYSPILHYVYLRERGLALAPDLILLAFDMTDVHDDFVRTAVARLDPRGLPVAVPSDTRRETALLLPPLGKPAALGFLDPLEGAANQLALWQAARRSTLGQRILGPLARTPERLEALGLVGNIQYDVEAITRDEESPTVQRAWALTERYLTGMRDLARARGLGFVLVLYPHPHQVSATASAEGRRRFGLRPGLYASERPLQILQALGRREGFPVITLLHHFRRHAAEGALFWQDDIHQTPLGARVFADGIGGGLLERGLVPC